MKVYTPSTLLREQARLATLAGKMRRLRPLIDGADPFSRYGQALRKQLQELDQEFCELERRHIAHGGEQYRP